MDFSACPPDERFTCLDYTCKALAKKQDPSFEPPPEWQMQYQGWWPHTPYLLIPEDIRRAAQPELNDRGAVMAKELIARSMPQAIFRALELLNELGKPVILTEDHKTFAILQVSDGMSPASLREHFEALAKQYFDPRLLSIRPQGAGSYDRQFAAALNCVSAYILLQTLSPAEAIAITLELLNRALYSTPQKWLEARDRGEFLLKKTLEAKLTEVLLLERLASALGR
jgi:hypothetical protein